MKRKNSEGRMILALVFVLVVLIVMSFIFSPRKKEEEGEEQAVSAEDIYREGIEIRVSGKKIYRNNEEISLEELQKELEDYTGNVPVIDDNADPELLETVRQLADQCNT